MIPGLRYIGEKPLSNDLNVEIFTQEVHGVEYSCYSGVGITYTISSNDENIDKINELICFKFDYIVSRAAKVYLTWTTVDTNFTRAVDCDDIEADSLRFYQMAEYLVKEEK